MGQFPADLAAKLAAELGIERAVETGTFLGQSTRTLARIFQHVETIELSPRLALRAKLLFLPSRNIRVLRGDSAVLLTPAVEPTLYWLDAHWSGDNTAGEERECPLLDELRATSPGTAKDCYLIDDAALFTERPPPPHRADQWPTLDSIKELVRELRPEHIVQVVGDLVVVLPRAAAHVIEQARGL
jgi:hypothetical protein